nr:retrotransposon protein, putative, unclassified [Tanacetum cinerariifolium]
YTCQFIQKYGLTSTDSADTPMIENKKLDEDLLGKPVDATLYHAYADADHAGYEDPRRSTPGSAQFLGDKLVSWSSKKQNRIAISLSVTYLLVYELYVTTLSRIMTFITAQQTKLDLELVPKENRLNIGKCNERIPRRLKPKEETFQVVLDALALTPCYPVFVLTVDILEVYMHQFWTAVYKHHDYYRFKIDKNKRFKLTLEVFRRHYIFS